MTASMQACSPRGRACGTVHVKGRRVRPTPLMAASTDAAGCSTSGIDQSAPLYTKLSTPVYSLATRGSDGRRDTMNLLTYCAPVSISPKRCMAVGLYRGTLSHENFMHAKEGVLQLLAEQHAPLFALLGKSSARDMDKLAGLAQHATLTTSYGHTVLADVACLLHLRAASEPVSCGDHDVVICEVAEYVNLSEAPQVLYTAHLREDGYL